MQIRISPELANELRILKKKNPKLIKRVNKQLKLFAENPKHPSLRTHKLSGRMKNLWSISVAKDLRMVYLLKDNQAYFVDLGTHDEVYRK